MTRAPSAQSIFKAIADPNRRRLLDLLLERDIAAQDLASRFDISFPAVSQHLSVLLKAGLVTKRAQGRQRVYCAAPYGLQAVHDWTAKYRGFWSGRLRSLGQYLDRGGKSSRSSPP
jgi:DNA-binding transcriptional ArsR family regulator